MIQRALKDKRRVTEEEYFPGLPPKDALDALMKKEKFRFRNQLSFFFVYIPKETIAGIKQWWRNFHMLCKWEYSHGGKHRECCKCKRKQIMYLRWGIVGGNTDRPMKCWEDL